MPKNVFDWGCAPDPSGSPLVAPAHAWCPRCFRLATALVRKGEKVEGRPPTNRTHRYAFCFCDLDFNPMTLIYELDLNILEIYLHTKNELSRSRLSKLRARRGQTDRHDRTYYHAAFGNG